MRIDAATELAQILAQSLPLWNFEVFATDSGNAAIAVTSKDLQSSFLISDLPIHSGLSGSKELEDAARAIALGNPSFRSHGVNVYGKSENVAFDATVQNGRVSLHLYCDVRLAEDIARLIERGMP